MDIYTGSSGLSPVTVTGTINGTNKVFTLSFSPNPSSSILLIYNGQLQQQGVDYTLSGTTITFTVAPTVASPILAFAGQGSVGTGILITVPSVSAMRTLNAYAYSFCYLSAQGQEGFFYYDAGDTMSADNTGTIIVSGTARFKRVYPYKTVYATWFGADPKGVSDSYDAIQTAIDSVNGDGVVMFGSGNYLLNKVGSAGAILLPRDAAGLTLKGNGEGTTTFTLSKNVPMLFYCEGNNSTTTPYLYQNITLQDFSVDAGNLTSDAMGGSFTATAVSGPSGGTVNVTVTSTTGLPAKGLLFLPYSNMGTSKGSIVAYTVTGGTTIQLKTSLTVLVGDVLNAALACDVIFGDNLNNGSTGHYGYNVNYDNITIKNIVAKNIVTTFSTQTFGLCEITRTGISFHSSFAPGANYTNSFITNIFVGNVRLYGGASGISIASKQSNPSQINQMTYYDNIVYDSCYHDTMLTSTKQSASLNFMIATIGYGGKSVIRNCHGLNSADVGIETDALLSVTVENCLVENAFTCGYYHTNFAPVTKNTYLRSTVGTYTTTLSADVAPGDTTIYLPIPMTVDKPGYLLIGTELMYYLTADPEVPSLSVVRGINGTVAGSHPASSVAVFTGFIGAYTASLSADVNPGDGTISLDAVPPDIAQVGYLLIDTELMYYTISYGSSTLNVIRGLNNKVGVCHSTATTVVFTEQEKQQIRYNQCTYRNNALNASIQAHLGRGWFQQRSTYWPNGNTILRNCVYERVGRDIGTAGEALGFVGQTQTIDIDGFKITIAGVNTTGSALDFQAINFNNIDSVVNTDNTIPPMVLRFKDIDIQVDAAISLSAFKALQVQNGNYYLDWEDIRVSANILNGTGRTFGIDLGFVVNYVSGRINNFKMANTGDGSPVGFRNASTLTKIGKLLIDNVDFYNLRPTTDSTMASYTPFVLMTPGADNIYIGTVRHASNLTLPMPARTTHRRIATGNLTAAYDDEYIGFSSTSSSYTVSLPKVTTGNYGQYRPTLGAVLIIADESGGAATHNITITPNGTEKINGVNSSIVINANYGSVRLMSIDGGWIKLS